MNGNRDNLNTVLHRKLKSKYNYCFYCGEYLNDNEKTVDHVIPLANGGEDKEDNIVVSCKKCNNNKGDYSLEEFIKLYLSGYFSLENIVKRKQSKIDSRVYKDIKNEDNLEKMTISLKDIIIPKNVTYPKQETIDKRLYLYKETGQFSRTAYAKKVKTKNGKYKYILNQGFTNYYISQKLGLKYMDVIVYTKKTNKKNKNFPKN